MISASEFHPLPGKNPLHVGIIPDGGRRWAIKNDCSLATAYRQTRKTLKVFVELLLNHGVREISIYLSSIQNFRRDHDVLDVILDAIGSSLEDEIAALARQQELRVMFAGKRMLLPESLAIAINRIEKTTEKNTRGRLNLLLAYDPLEEAIQAFNNCPDPGCFFKYLWVPDPVDLVIRTGDAPLISNFLPLQSGFARLFFSEKLFNDFTSEDLAGVLRDFETLDRKFGT